MTIEELMGLCGDTRTELKNVQIELMKMFEKDPSLAAVVIGRAEQICADVISATEDRGVTVVCVHVTRLLAMGIVMAGYQARDAVKRAAAETGKPH